MRKEIPPEKPDEKLSKREWQLSESQRVARLGSWDLDLVTQKLDWTVQTYRLFDKNPESYIPSFNDFARMVDPDDLQTMQTNFNKALESDATPYHVVVRIINDTGKRWYMEAFGDVRRDVDGKAIGILGTAQDVTELKKAEEAIHKLNEDLEKRIAQRTAQLATTIQRLRDGIYQRELSEQAVKQSEDKYRQLFENMTAGFALHEMIYDDKGHPSDYRFLEINPAFERLTGASASNLLGKTVKEVMTDTEQYWIDVYGRVAQTGEPASYQNYSKELNRYYDVWAFSPGEDKFAVVFTDITERKQAEDNVRRSQEQLELALHSSQMAVFEWDIIRNKRIWSDGVHRLLGTNPKTFTGTVDEFLQIIHQDDRSSVQAALDRAMKTSEYESEYRAIWPDGSIHHIAARGKVSYDKAGQAVHMTGVCWDITRRRQIEQELCESEECFRSAFEHAAIGFAIYSIDGHFLRVNKALCNILGYTEDELRFKTYQDITHPDDLRLNLERVNKLLTGIYPSIYFQKRYIHKFGHEVWTSLNVSLIHDDKGKPLYLISLIEDLTEKRKLEDQLRHAQKMESIGILAGGVAHDFNNILTAIIGFGSLAKLSINDNDKTKDCIDEMLAGANRAAELTHSLLAFSRKQTIILKQVDINDVVRKFQKMLHRVIGEDIELTIELLNTELNVLIDRGQMEQVLMNLAVNARDAMPNGGELIIRTDMTYVDSRYAEDHNLEITGNYALLIISDTGIGMDKKTKENIFEPFFTTKGVGKGTGLGLSMVYGMVKQHEGSIEVQSESGKGATFSIYLPMVNDAAKEERKVSKSTPLGTGQTILLAEDNAQVRTVISMTLKGSGYKVIEAEGGEEAVQRYIEHFIGEKEWIPLLIFDVVMPGKNGRDAFEEIKAISPDIKVIFVSGYTEDIMLSKGILSEGFEFISKPLKPDALLRKVHEVLAK